MAREKEAALAEKARRGDPGAFDLLMSVYAERLRRHVRAKIWGDENDVDDVAQETWADVWEKVRLGPEEGGFDPGKSRFYYWVKTCIAQYKIRHWMDRWHRRVRGVVSTDQPGGEEDGLELPDPGAAEPEVWAQLHEAYLELFELVFRCGGYPHQQLAFALAQHVYGTRSKRGVRGAPKEVDEKHGREPLGSLAGTYWELYRAQSAIEDPAALERISSLLEPLRRRLGVVVRELLAGDRASLDQLREILAEPAGRTCLEQYYGNHAGGFTVAIPDWSNKVKVRVQEVLQSGPKACPRCKLRHLPPCTEEGIRITR